MCSKAQSSVEWLMTHAWSIIIVLSVSAVLFYAGVFEATGRPRFEGLAAGLRPMPEQVQLYSDGILVLAIANTKPYKYTYEWVEVAPIADKDNTIRTTLGAQIPQGGIGVYYVNGSNLLGISEAAIITLPESLAREDTVDFYYRHQETYSAAGTSGTYTTPWATAHQITKNPENSPVGGSRGGSGDCKQHLQCACDGGNPCPLSCQVCWGGICDNYRGCVGNEVVCQEDPLGKLPGVCDYPIYISCSGAGDCPLVCHTCSGGFCGDGCSIGACRWTEAHPEGECV